MEEQNILKPVAVKSSLGLKKWIPLPFFVSLVFLTIYFMKATGQDGLDGAAALFVLVILGLPWTLVIVITEKLSLGEVSVLLPYVGAVINLFVLYPVMIFLLKLTNNTVMWKKALGYLGILVIAVILGLVFYIFFSQNCKDWYQFITLCLV